MYEVASATWILDALDFLVQQTQLPTLAGHHASDLAAWSNTDGKWRHCIRSKFLNSSRCTNIRCMYCFMRTVEYQARGASGDGVFGNKRAGSVVQDSRGEEGRAADPAVPARAVVKDAALGSVAEEPQASPAQGGGQHQKTSGAWDSHRMGVFWGLRALPVARRRPPPPPFLPPARVGATSVLVACGATACRTTASYRSSSPAKPSHRCSTC